MAKIGTISVIPKDFDSAFPTMEKSLRANGMSMFPGTYKMLFPHKELSGKRRTGLDPNAQYIQNIKDVAAKEVEQERVAKLRDELQLLLDLDLSPTSKYWDKMEPAKLGDEDNIFNLDNPNHAVMFAWLRVHPTIASSLEAYTRGEYHPDTHFYVKDKDLEETIVYNKKKQLNEAIRKIDSYSLEKRQKIARLVGIPVSSETKEEFVYNALDTFLRNETIKSGPYKDQSSLAIFTRFSQLDDQALYIKDLVDSAVTHQIYREGKTGRIMEGDVTKWTSKDAMFKYFMSDENQRDLIELEDRIKAKAITTA